jgi:subtilase family serine protease
MFVAALLLTVITTFAAPMDHDLAVMSLTAQQVPNVFPFQLQIKATVKVLGGQTDDPSKSVQVDIVYPGGTRHFATTLADCLAGKTFEFTGTTVTAGPKRPITAKVDPTKKISDAHRDNNNRTIYKDIVDFRCDLEPYIASARVSVVNGATKLTLTYGVKNNGPQASKAGRSAKIRIAPPNGSFTQITQKSLAAIQKGSFFEETLTLSVSQSKSFTVEVDVPANEVDPEVTTANNLKRKATVYN